MANVWPATQSQLYSELNKLAAADLITVTDIGPRGRKEYCVTDAGSDELLRWLTSPQDDPPYRSAALLRMFLLGEMPPERARNYVVAVAEHAESELTRFEELRASVDWPDTDAGFYGRAALEFGLRTEAMAADWARWLIKEMDRRN